MSSNIGPNGPTLQNAALAAELRAYNATLTPSGAPKHRPGRGLAGHGGNSISRGMGTRVSLGHPPPTSASDTATRVSMLGNHLVGSRATQAPVRGAFSSTARRASHASPTSGSNPYCLPASNIPPASTPTLGLSPLQIELLNTPRHAPTLPSQVAVGSTQPSPVILGSSNIPQPQGFGNTFIGANASAGGTFPMAPPPVPSFAAVNNQVNVLQPAAISTRQPIVTNWGPDPVGPTIPSHLRQTSASAAIAEMAELIGMKYEDLTTDGMTIPAPRPRNISQQQQRTPSGDVVMSTSAPQVQENVDPAIWMAAKKSGHRQTSSEMDVDTDNEDATKSMAMAQSVRGSGNLDESIWNQQKWGLPIKRPAMSEHTQAVPFNQGVGAVNNTQNVRTVVVGGLKDSKFATPSQNAHAHPSGALRSVSNGWSSQAAVPPLTLSRANYGSTANPLRQTATQTQPSFGSHNSAPVYPPYAPVSAAANPAVAKKKEKSLKDSMWA